MKKSNLILFWQQLQNLSIYRYYLRSSFSYIQSVVSRKLHLLILGIRGGGEWKLGQSTPNVSNGIYVRHFKILCLFHT